MTDMIANLIQYLGQIYNFPFAQSLIIMSAIALFYFGGCLVTPEGRKSFGMGTFVWGLIFSFYLSQVIGITLLNRMMEEEMRYDLSPFEVYRKAFNGNHVFMTQLIGNVVMFIPFGVLVPICFKRADGFFKIILCSFAFSLAIEITQLYTHTGIFEIPDLMNNTAGGVIGYVGYKMIYWIYRFLKKEKN